MRLVLVVLLSGGCLGGTLDSNLRPAVTPKLSELPADRERRDAVLDSAQVTTGPEQDDPSSRQLTKKERRAVGTAATAAAVLGWIFSDTENVTLGAGTSADENELFVPSRPTAKSEHEKDATDPVATDRPAPETLVPWVKFK